MLRNLATVCFGLSLLAAFVLPLVTPPKRELVVGQVVVETTSR